MKSSLANILVVNLILKLGLVVAFAPIHSKKNFHNIGSSSSCTSTYQKTGNSNVIQNSLAHPRPFKTSSHLTMMPSPMDETTSLLIHQYYSSLASLSSSSSQIISTVSSDIDSIPTDDFGTVFAGGIAVMIGGVISTLMVGFLLERGDSYASVVAESYAQGGDEEFWKSLSPEDQEKAREMLEKLRQSKEGANAVGKDEGKSVLSASGGESMTEATAAAVEEKSQDKKSDKNEKSKKEAISMFSDYDD
jgi:hypothetical protein